MKLRHLLVPALVLIALAGTTVSKKMQDSQLYPPAGWGTINPDITQATIAATICSKAWSTSSIRPPSNLTSKLKLEQIQTFKLTDTDPSHYEEDHIISLELGGNPTDPKNLWPESYFTSHDGQTMGAHQKDKVENYLHKEVCAGSITLEQAQKDIVNDWVKVYDIMTDTTGEVSTSDDE